MPKSSRSNQTFQRPKTTIWRPKPTSWGDQIKLRIWIAWLHLVWYELFNLEKLFNIRSPDRLWRFYSQFSSRKQNLMLAKSSLCILALSKSLFILNLSIYPNIYHFKFKTSFSALSQNPEQRLPANELQDIVKVKVNFAICLSSNSWSFHDR